MAQFPTLTHNQRNLYLFFLHHQRSRPDEPCFVPRNPIQGSYNNGEHKDATYKRIIRTLEGYGLFRVDRSGDTYREWTLHPPNDSSLQEDWQRSTQATSAMGTPRTYGSVISQGPVKSTASRR